MATATTSGASVLLAEVEAAMVAAAGTTEGMRLINAVTAYCEATAQDLAGKLATAAQTAYGNIETAAVSAEQHLALAVTATKASFVNELASLFQRKPAVPPTA